MLLQQLDPKSIREYAEVFEIEPQDFMMYLTIFQKGSMTIGKLAEFLQVDRGRTYRSVDKLESFGYITKTMSNPTVVNAVEPREILQLIRVKHENAAKNVSSEHLDEFFENLKIRKKQPKLIKTYFLTGTDNYLAKAKLVIEEAEAVKMYLSQDTLKRIYYTDIPDLIKQKKKNVTVIAKDLKLVKRLNPGIMRKRTDALDRDVIVTDNAVIIDVGAMNTGERARSFYYNSDDANYMYTTNGSLIYIASVYLESLNGKR